MTATAVIGAQWGDEGKGKVVDYLGRDASLVVRFQGGDNAGHTVVNPRGTFVLRLVPCGIFHEGARCLIGAGVAVNPRTLLSEMDHLAGRGVKVDGLLVDRRATLVMPWHPALDRLEEEARGAAPIGTTLRGVGPAFADKAGRWGLKVEDLLEKDWFARRVRESLSMVNPLLTRRYGAPAVDPDAVVEQYWAMGARWRDRIVDSLPVVREALTGPKPVILEGQLGVMRDLDWGTYPYVTSSSPTPGGAAAGAGVPPWAITRVIGVAKAYTTAVGEGPFPVGEDSEIGAYLLSRGQEYGAVTGRPRRCGWFDAVAARYAVAVAGVTELALTKVDIMDGLDRVGICTAYQVDAKGSGSVEVGEGSGGVGRGGTFRIGDFPPGRLLQKARPVFEHLPGWTAPTAGVRYASELPAAARRFVRRLEELVGVPVRLLSTGPNREDVVTLT